MKLNHRYSVPMSLWLVVVIQRMMPARAVVGVIAVVVPVAVVDDCAHWRCSCRDPLLAGRLDFGRLDMSPALLPQELRA